MKKRKAARLTRAAPCMASEVQAYSPLQQGSAIRGSVRVSRAAPLSFVSLPGLLLRRTAHHPGHIVGQLVSRRRIEHVRVRRLRLLRKRCTVKR